MDQSTGRREMRLYSEDDAQAILRTAMGLQLEGREFSSEHLAAMAQELGISPEQLAAAEGQWREGQGLEGELAAFRSHRRREWRKHLFVFVVVNFALLLFSVGLSIAVGEFIPIVLFSLVGWGIGLAIDGYDKLVTSDGEEFENDFLEWRRNRERRLARLSGVESRRLERMEQ